jgi:hypothetical protein
MSKKKRHQDDLDKFIKARGLRKRVNSILINRAVEWSTRDEFREDGKLLDDAEL